jgi:hypothetical protein
MNRVDLFRKAIVECLGLQRRYASCPALISIEKQLRYLLDIELGLRADRELLNSITIGLIAAREIEPLDLDVATTLYDVASEVHLMMNEK